MKTPIRAGVLALALAVPLGGCTYLNPILHPTDTQAQLAAEKGLIAAHDAHDLAALLASAMAKSRSCIDICASTVKTYIDQSEALLVQADAVSDAVTITGKIALAMALIEKAKELLK